MKINNKKHDNLNKIAIDSFKLRIELSKCKIISNELNELVTKLTVINLTGEVISDEKSVQKKIYCEKHKAIKVEFTIENIYNFKLNVNVPYLTIKITAKLLKQKYLKGITKENICIIYDNLMQCEVVEFKKATLLESIVTDIDLKKDVNMLETEYVSVTDYLKSVTKPTKQANMGYRLFGTKNNQGIQFSERKYATPSNPYFKIYNKNIEMSTKSKEFYNEYLQNVDLKNIYRLEVTIKNKKHFDKLKIGNTLNHILLANQQQKNEIINNIISKHINLLPARAMQQNQNRNFTNYEQLILHYLQLSLETNQSINCAITIFTDKIDNPSKKSRAKKKMLAMSKYLSNEQINASNYLEKLLEKLNIRKNQKTHY